MSPHCAPTEQTNLRVRAVRTIAPSNTIFRSSSAGFAWNARPSAYSVGPAWNVEPNHCAPRRGSPSSVFRGAVAWLPWSSGRWPIRPTDVEGCRLGENSADRLLETSVRAQRSQGAAPRARRSGPGAYSGNQAPADFRQTESHLSNPTYSLPCSCQHRQDSNTDNV